MKSWILSIILSVCLFSQTGFAQLCSVLKDVRIGEAHTLCLDADDKLWSCGRGGYAMGLGDSATSVFSLKRVLDGDMNTPSGYVENVKIFDAGWYHSLVVDSNGNCYAFGTDPSGQLGNGDYEGDSSVPTKVHGLNNDANGLKNIVMVSAGRSGQHSLFVRNDGYILSCGLNDQGQCGDGTSGSGSDKQFPVLVLSTGENPNFTYLGQEAFIVDVEAGVKHSLALQRLTDGGKIFEWGSNVCSIPRKVPGEYGVGYLSHIVDIATCYCSLAADSNGNVWYWQTGGNPTRIAGGAMGTTYLQNIKKVAAGSDICAALDNNKNVWMWTGRNGSPVKVVDGEQNTSTGFLENIVAVDVGYGNQIITIDDFGYGYGWYNNGGGALGIGNDTTPSEPAEMLCADISPAVEFELSYEIQGLEPNCARPFVGFGINDNYLVYSITYANPITNPSDPNYVGTISDVNIINELPLEVEYYASDPCAVYDSNTRKIIWHIGDLSPGAEGVLTLTVMVNDFAKPCSKITDFAYLTGKGYYTYTDVNVPVCPYGSEIIYVDSNAVNGSKNGTDWENAYLTLVDAFTQIKNGCSEVTAIWVANGVYQPVYDANENGYQNKSFELIEGVGLFGNFAGGESSIEERDFNNPANETILDGRIGSESSQAVNKVVKAENIVSGIIDGFTIRNSNGGAGVYLDNSNVAIVNCKLKNNNNYGVRAENYSYPDIHNCLFIGNSSQNINAANGCYPIVSYCTFDGNDTTSKGIEVSSYTNVAVENSIFKNHTEEGINGSDSEVNAVSCKFESNNGDGLEFSNVDAAITKCKIKNSGDNGISASSGSSLVLKNSIISHNGKRGVSLNNNAVTSIVNNWIHHNGINQSSGEGAGIYSSNHTVNALNIRNTTIYDNYTYGVECGQYGADPNIRNCIITGNDSNDLYRTGGSFNKINYSLLQHSHSGIGNKTGDPGFVNIEADEDDLHLDILSQCVDVGDPNGNYAETDIDGESRITNSRVDLGGDELYVSNADFNSDNIVDYDDLYVLCQAWLTQVAGMPDIVDNNFIDFADFAAFANDWQWKPAWADKRILLSTDFESGIPSTWTVVNGGSSTHTWMTNNPYGRTSSYWTGNFCLVDSAWASSVDMNESLITPVIDCSGALEVNLKFSHDFGRNENEKCDVDVSINNGAWQRVLQYTGASASGNVIEDISEFAAGQSNVKIRWHYYNANYENYWGIDTVQIIGNYRTSAVEMLMSRSNEMSLESTAVESDSSTLEVETESTLLSSSSNTASTDSSSDNSLLLSGSESKSKRPQRLIAKSQKFYNITPETTNSARQKIVESEKNEKRLANLRTKPTLETESAMSLASESMQIEQAVDVNSLLNWLDDAWANDPNIRNSMTEAEYLEFRNSIENAE
jgi:alpha-tubulin suppressor-like RCC1 family protein